jgi:hypothetical protein
VAGGPSNFELGFLDFSPSVEAEKQLPATFEEGAEIAIINTCTVTQRADFQSRQMVRRASPFQSEIPDCCHRMLFPS